MSNLITKFPGAAFPWCSQFSSVSHRVKIFFNDLLTQEPPAMGTKYTDKVARCWNISGLPGVCKWCVQQLER